MAEQKGKGKMSDWVRFREGSDIEISPFVSTVDCGERGLPDGISSLRRLCSAMLNQAWLTVTNPALLTEKDFRSVISDLEWFFPLDENRDYVFSFWGICEVLHLNPQAVRKELAKVLRTPGRQHRHHLK